MSLQSLRIAVGTADRVHLCDHLARSAAFHVLEVENGTVVSQTVRERDSGPCGRHASFVEILDGCQAVLCGGIGQGAAVALEASGIKPVVAAAKHTIDDAVKLYLEGKLVTTDERVCLCH